MWFFVDDRQESEAFSHESSSRFYHDCPAFAMIFFGLKNITYEANMKKEESNFYESMDIATGPCFNSFHLLKATGGLW